MKSLVFSLLFILICFSSFSQSIEEIYSSKKNEIVRYLDSTYKAFESQSNKFDTLNYSNPIGFQKLAVFGDSVKLLETPSKDSKILSVLSFGDSVYIPYYNTKYKDGGQFHGSIFFVYFFKEMENEYVQFCLTEDGIFSFIKRDDLFIYYGEEAVVIPVPENNCLIYKEWLKLGVVKNDFSKSSVLYTQNIDFSEDKEIIAFSVDKYDEPDYQSIYLFNLKTWIKTYVAEGFSPKFIDNCIVYYSGSITQRKDQEISEKLHIYDLISKTDNVIFTVQDSLTLWNWAGSGDFVNPGRIIIDLSSNKNNFRIDLFFNNEEFDEKKIEKSFNLKGELIEEKLKDKYIVLGK
jgi:hypothetical protein